MLSHEVLGQIKSLAREVSEREGCYLYDLEVVGAGQARTVRVYIDKEEQSASVDDCANVSRGLGVLLDVQDLIKGGAYELEVSTPGVERPLKEPWHFEKAIGKLVKFKTHEPVAPEGSEAGKNKVVQGRLQAVEAGRLRVTEAKKEWVIALDNVEKAHVVFEFKTSAKTKKKR